MIEEALLPMGRLSASASQRFRKRVLQRFHPHGDIVPIVKRGEEMNVIGHDDVAAHVDAAIECGCAEEAEGFVNIGLASSFSRL